MRYSQILNEVRITNIRTTGSKYWVLLKSGRLYSVPFVHGYPIPDFKEWFSKEYGAQFGRDKTKQLLNTPEPGNIGYCLVDKENGIVDLDMTIWLGKRTRRPASQLSNYDDNTPMAYPVLCGDNGFLTSLDVWKTLKALVESDPETRTLWVVGDIRFDGTVNDVINSQVSGHHDIWSTRPLVMYHGTSYKRATNILRTGLTPGFRIEDYADLVNGWSERNVYLTFRPDQAANYATREAINDGSDAVILRIQIPHEDKVNLVPDEDAMIKFSDLPKQHRDLFMAKNPLVEEIWGSDFDIHISELNHKSKSCSIDNLLRKRHPAWAQASRKKIANIQQFGSELYSELMLAFADGTFDHSAKKLGALAYRGTIPIDQISIIKIWSIGNEILGSSDTQYHTSIMDQQLSVRHKII